jgi:hypothetical protein
MNETEFAYMINNYLFNGLNLNAFSLRTSVLLNAKTKSLLLIAKN